MEAIFRNYGCRIKDSIIYKGLRTIFLENDLLRIGVLVDKGSDIFEFLYKPQDMDFVWLSPFGIKDPKTGLLTKSQQAGKFLDYYEGGWQDIFPNGGNHCSYNGIEFGRHDEISLLPWNYEIIEDSKEKVIVKLWVNTRLTPFYVEKLLILEKGNPCLMVSEKVFNKSPVDIKTIFGIHLVYGHPFLDEHCKINISAKKGRTYEIEGYLDDNIELEKEFDWPFLPTRNGKETDLSIIPSKDTITAKFLYLSELEKGQYEIINEKIGLKIVVNWNKDIMPFVWFWQEFNKTDGYPWYKMARVLGLEPFSTNIMGLKRTVEKNKALIIEANSELRSDLEVAIIKSDIM